MFLKTVVVVAALGCLAVIDAYSTGAPKEVCDDMTPQHHTEPQRTRSPYIIRMTKTKIKAGETSEITITGKGGESFKGFLIQARVGATPVGQFSSKSPDVQLIDCGSGSKNAATHVGPTEKKEVKVTWTAPPNLKESVYFYATIAKDGGTYWVKQKSRNLVVA